MKLLETFKHEFKHLLPPTVFFFFAFLLLTMTHSLIQNQYQIPLSGLGIAVIGALLVGKVVLITDKLPIMNRFPEKPLLYNIAWKSSIYFFATFLIRYIEHIFPLYRDYGNFSEASQHLLAEVVWPHFWLIQMWLAVLFFLYCSLRELVLVIGREQTIRLFVLGKTGSAN